MAYNEVGRNATNRYRSKFDLIQIRIPRGYRDTIREHVKTQNESVNSFVVRAIKETMENDKKKKPE